MKVKDFLNGYRYNYYSNPMHIPDSMIEEPVKLSVKINGEYFVWDENGQTLDDDCCDESEIYSWSVQVNRTENGVMPVLSIRTWSTWS